MRREQFIPLLLILLLTHPVGALAQEKLAFLGRAGADELAIIEVDVSVSNFGATTVTPIPPQQDDYVVNPVAVPGARFLTWGSYKRGGFVDSHLFVFDRETGTTSVRDFWPDITFTDPLRPRVFSTYPVSGSLEEGLPFRVHVYDLDTGVSKPILRRFPEPPSPSRWTYAAAVDQLFAFRYLGFTTADIARIDVSTGIVVQTFAADFSSKPTWMVATRDGRRLFTYAGGELVPRPVVAMDTTTGAEIARTPPVATNRDPAFDEERGLLLIVNQPSSELLVIDTRSMAVTTLPIGDNAGAQVLPGRWMTGAYIIDGTASPVADTVIRALSPSGRLQNSVKVQAGRYRVAGDAVLLRSPVAPQGLAATVTPGSVNLSWKNPGDALAHGLQVGLVPGSTMLRLPIDKRVSGASFAGVPPGVYYVRVRAANAIGVGPDSNEVRIEVR